jgi:hypothetical protein
MTRGIPSALSSYFPVLHMLSLTPSLTMKRFCLCLLAAIFFIHGIPRTGLAQNAEPEPRDASMMRLDGNWRMDGDLPRKALLISLQGVANLEDPQLYFIYPPDWTYTFTESVYEYYQDTHNIRFTTISSTEEALQKFHDHANGYVVWDEDIRTSLTVAFTVAGLNDAVVVTEDQIPMVESFGLEKIEDFRDQFTGQSDYEIYKWAWKEYGDQTSKEFIVWMGGRPSPRMEPGIADFGIYEEAFFTDLSANPKDSLELELADQILDTMNPGGMVMGWHSYAKDTEGQHVTLVSQHALRMEGLNTLPNTSFNTQIPTTPGYEFENNHNVSPDTTIQPKEKVYIAPVQTDGLGIGAWLKEGRGELPYAWEVTMNWQWLSPALLQYFYDQATPNDYFIGMLSGPGYMYPKAVPESKLPQLLDEAESLMEKLDLRVFEIMDYSQGTRQWGNLDLTEEVVDTYYEEMPNAIGFINGYGPATTFDLRGDRPFMSYDYYLGEDRPRQEVIADLRELARLNKERPYFLLLHVRQRSTVQQVKKTLDALGPEFETVPLDVFLKMAASEPTFDDPHYLPPEYEAPESLRPTSTGLQTESQ